MRADNLADARRRIAEIREIVGYEAQLVAEEYLPGVEVALEGLVGPAGLITLAVFDKPGASEGPYFEETILVTPSRLGLGIISEVERVAGRAVNALGIGHGPVHVEMKVDGDEVRVLEIAARSIGGLCSRTLDFGLTGTSLETLILRNALGLDKPELRRSGKASGVLMIPIPRPGRFAGIPNLDDIREIPNVTGIDLSVRPGTWVDPPPVGERYVGFVFAKGENAHEVTRALQDARDSIEVIIE
jgi:formate-dependent phosphoribosylglycinamide formyltransferase (GAR transformylase)